MVVLVHVYTIYCCFCATLAELSSCNKDPMAHETYNIKSLVHNRNSLLTLGM